jgi:hypothetical protein
MRQAEGYAIFDPVRDEGIASKAVRVANRLCVQVGMFLGFFSLQYQPSCNAALTLCSQTSSKQDWKGVS